MHRLAFFLSLFPSFHLATKTSTSTFLSILPITGSNCCFLFHFCTFSLLLFPPGFSCTYQQIIEFHLVVKITRISSELILTVLPFFLSNSIRISCLKKIGIKPASSHSSIRQLSQNLLIVFIMFLRIFVNLESSYIATYEIKELGRHAILLSRCFVSSDITIIHFSWLLSIY